MTASSPPASTDCPSRTWISATTPSRAGAKLVLHLHRLDDDNRLARAHVLSRLDEHAHDFPGIGATMRCGPSPARPPSPRLFERRRPLSESDTDLAPTLTTSWPKRSAGTMVGLMASSAPDRFIDQQRQRLAVDRFGVHLPLAAVDVDNEPAVRAMNDRAPHTTVDSISYCTLLTLAPRRAQPLEARPSSSSRRGLRSSSRFGDWSCSRRVTGDSAAWRAAAIAATSSTPSAASANGWPLRAFSNSSRYVVWKRPSRNSG